MSETDSQQNDRSGLVDVYCANCGADRSGDMTLTNTKRSACSACGATNLQYRRQVTEVASVSVSVSTALTPGRQVRDWQLRWEQIRQRAAGLSVVHTGPRSAAAIHAAAQEIIDFYVFAYHLKDRLIAEKIKPKKKIESAITADPTLALLADLANLDKHFVLDRPPRSGDTPIVHVSDTSSGQSWHLVMSIRHKGTTVEGVAFAHSVVTSWQLLLEQWGLFE